MLTQPQLYTYPPKRDQSAPFDPPKEIMEWDAKFRVTRVQQWDGIQAWLVTRYEDCRFVLSDPRFSANPDRPGFPEKSAAYSAVMGRDKNLRTMDNPEHSIQKRMLARDFTVKRLEDMRRDIQRRVDELLTEILAKGPPAELFEDLAFPVPTMVICKLLGVPYEDSEFFAKRSYICTSHTVTKEEAAQAGDELSAYIDKLMDKKDQDPQDDLISRLVVEQLRTGNIERKDIIGLARFILIAGHETTANTIALSTVALLENPDQLALLKANSDDPAFLANAIDELLRYLSVAHTGRRRVCIEDVMVGGQLIKAGEGVIIANNAGDRDESVFPEANKLDLRRPNARASIVFGYGMHQCLGQLLSRIELQVVHGALWKRIPSLRLARPFSELHFKEDTPVFGVRDLYVEWDA